MILGGARGSIDRYATYAGLALLAAVIAFLVVRHRRVRRSEFTDPP